jgi:hypothetical protein
MIQTGKKTGGRTAGRTGEELKTLNLSSNLSSSTTAFILSASKSPTKTLLITFDSFLTEFLIGLLSLSLTLIVFRDC